MQLKPILKLLCVGLAVIMAASCVDTKELDDRLDKIENESLPQLYDAISKANDNATALAKLMRSSIRIVEYRELTAGDAVTGYELELSDGSTVKVTFGDKLPSTMPLISIDKDGNWLMSLDNGENYSLIDKAANAFSEDGTAPEISINEEKFWVIRYSADGEWELIRDADGMPVPAGGKAVSVFKNVIVDSENNVVVFTIDGGLELSVRIAEPFTLKFPGYTKDADILLDYTVEYRVEMDNVQDVVIRVPEGWKASLKEEMFSVTSPAAASAGLYTVEVYAVSTQGYLKNVSMTFNLRDVTYDAALCREWNDFVAGTADNVLLDFSYAGYKHGETAPPDVYSLGYKVYNVCDYGAVPNDGKSDRQAFLDCVAAATGTAMTINDDKGQISFADKKAANCIIYFPEGDFILHNADDDKDGKSYGIIIRSSNFIIKGAGMDKTRIIMDAPMQAENPEVLYSSPDMLLIAHWNTYKSFATPAKVTADAAKGSYAVTVASTAGISAGDFVCLNLAPNKTEACVRDELGSFYGKDKNQSNWDIVNKGVEVIDYHQVKAVEGNVVTFYEPIMHEVKAVYDWEVKQYYYRENVGVEDLTFSGHAKDKFHHHGSWQDDGAYKPLSFSRCVNSWIRRVRYDNTSEGTSLTNCANVSVYNVEFTGNRGHASVRSAASSRVLIAATVDKTRGYLVGKGNGVTGTYDENAGNYHAVGVSKQSIGAVLWRNDWGEDSNFESHATQPRATLIDCCTGGWMRWRQGGDETQVPNHLADLTIWNMNVKNTEKTGADGSINSNFGFWDFNSPWWKILPPVIVGFHGNEDVTFDAAQVVRDSEHGRTAYPESLYEAQLQNRLGSVPAWLNELK